MRRPSLRPRSGMPLLGLLLALLSFPCAPAAGAAVPATGGAASPDPAVAAVDGGQGADPADPSADWYDDVQTVDDGGAGGDAGGGAQVLPTPVVPIPTPAPGTTKITGLSGVRYRGLIVRYAALRGLEPALVAAVIHAESGFNPRAVSKVGARGLMQLMPATAREMGAPVARLFDPETNIAAGTRYLASLKRSFGASVRLIAAAYNAGPGAVRKSGGVPPFAETRAYVARVVALRARYRKV